MGELVNRRRRGIAGIVSMVVGAACLVWALPGNAGAQEPTESTTSTSVVTGNPDCGDLGEFAFEFKIDEQPVEGQVYGEEPGLVVTITDVTEGDPMTFSFTTNIPVSAVYVKAGPGGILYTFDPPTTVGTNLASPKSDISHVSFCWNKPEATTTTTTTTSTVPDTTGTTVAGPTTTAPGVSPTTVPGELPRTGSTTGPMVGIGAALLAGGAGLVGFARRFRHS